MLIEVAQRSAAKKNVTVAVVVDITIAKREAAKIILVTEKQSHKDMESISSEVKYSATAEGLVALRRSV
jgi:hypothetical protein